MGIELHKAELALKYKLEFFTELILAMSGDTAEKFTHSLRDVTDKLLANNIDVHLLTLLKGSVMETKPQRDPYKIKPKFRVFVGCFGKYLFGNETKPVFEIEEVVVENNTFSFDEVVQARILHLTLTRLIEKTTKRIHFLFQ